MSGLNAASYFKIGTGVVTSLGTMAGNRNPMPEVNSFNPYAAGNPFQAGLNLQSEAYDSEAKLLEQQGQIAVSDAGAAAGQKAREAKQFRENQAMVYNNSGVLLEGSPMLVLEETRRLAEEEIRAITERGSAQGVLYNQKAGITRGQGRAAMLGQQGQYNSAATEFAAKQALIKGTSMAPHQAGIGDLLASLGGLIGDDSKYKNVNGKTKKTATGAVVNSLPDPLSDPISVSRQFGYTFDPGQF